MAEVVPGVSIFAVVLANRSPLPLAEVRSPLLPRNTLFARLIQSFLFVDFDINKRCGCCIFGRHVDLHFRSLGGDLPRQCCRMSGRDSTTSKPFQSENV